jgi:hypothetical protein
LIKYAKVYIISLRIFIKHIFSNIFLFFFFPRDEIRIIISESKFPAKLYVETVFDFGLMDMKTADFMFKQNFLLY